MARQPPPAVPPAIGPTPAPPVRSSSFGWGLKALGLVLVAVVSGMLWWLIQQGRDHVPSDGQANQTQPPAGQFSFAQHEDVPTNWLDSNCAAHAYGRVKDFFSQNPCTNMARALYTTTTADRKPVYTAVAVVEMPDAAKATALRALTDDTGTGNVRDIIDENTTVKVTGLPSLANGGYASAVRDRFVIITLSDWAPKATRTKEQEAQLKAVSVDAIRLGDEILRAAGHG